MNDSIESGSWWKRLSGGLKRTSASLGGAIADLVSKRKLDAAAVEDLESELIRADAIDQRKTWATRTGASVKASSPGADAASLAFDAITAAKAESTDVVLV